MFCNIKTPSCQRRLLDGLCMSYAWLDTGTQESLLDTSQLEALAQPLLKSGYGKYLASLLKDTVQR
jgi:dTDP-glucose pyrophosphorylase